MDDILDGDSVVTLDEDVFNLQNVDHPRMVLVSVPLTENNFLPWIKVVKISLVAKAKLGFIDGTIDPPSQNSTLYVSWRNGFVLAFEFYLQGNCRISCLHKICQRSMA